MLQGFENFADDVFLLCFNYLTPLDVVLGVRRRVGTFYPLKLY